VTRAAGSAAGWPRDHKALAATIGLSQAGAHALKKRELRERRKRRLCRLERAR
jgi:hypothetical protein